MQAIVLRRADSQEFDQQIHLYAAERGLVVATARGSKHIKSKNASRLEPGNVVDIGLEGNPNRPTVTFVHPIATAPRLNSIGAQAVSAFCLHWTSMVLKPGMPDPHVFQLLLQWLAFLGQTKDPYVLGPIDQYFGQLLAILGLGEVKTRSHDMLLQQFRYRTELAIPDWRSLKIS